MLTLLRWIVVVFTLSMFDEIEKRSRGIGDFVKFILSSDAVRFGDLFVLRK